MVVAETNRLLISRFTIDDAPFYLELVNAPNWIKFIGDRGVKTLSHAQEKIETTILPSYKAHGYGAYKLELKDDKLAAIGCCGLYRRDYLKHPDIGFALLEAFERQGFGYESSVEIIKLAEHTFNLSKVLAITLPTNKASIRLLEKLGMEHEKTIIPFEDDEELLLFAKNLNTPSY